MSVSPVGSHRPDHLIRTDNVYAVNAQKVFFVQSLQVVVLAEF
jgi:hypothetical protein